MNDSKTPKSDWLRAMRERNAEERWSKAKPAPKTPAENIVLAKAALSNAGLTASNKASFDKTAYQREYMRIKRAKEKA